MITDVKQLVESLKSPGDWAVALGAGVIGLVVDGAINIAPLPFFSPGICGGISASAAISAKKGVEAWFLMRKKSRRVKLWRREAIRLIDELRSRESDQVVRDFEFELELTDTNEAELEKLVRRHRGQVQGSATAQMMIPVRWYGGSDEP